jgi:hypothetical protein
MNNALHVLAATSSTSHSTAGPKPVAPVALIVFIIWCLNRTPSPNSTIKRDLWAGLASAIIGPFAFWIKRRWSLGFIWAGIWAASFFIYMSVPSGPIVAVSLIGCLLIVCATPVFVVKAGAKQARATVVMSPPPPVQSDTLTAARTLDERQTRGSQ